MLRSCSRSGPTPALLAPGDSTLHCTVNLSTARRATQNSSSSGQMALVLFLTFKAYISFSAQAFGTSVVSLPVSQRKAF